VLKIVVSCLWVALVCYILNIPDKFHPGKRKTQDTKRITKARERYTFDVLLVTACFDSFAKQRRYSMEAFLGERLIVYSCLTVASALLRRAFVATSFHAWTSANTRAQQTRKTHVIPESGSFSVAPVTIATVVDICKRNA
jgi:hypothetical protein